jgi:ubiquinone/menaquinone biosynthesis C-methylase UbiE
MRRKSETKGYRGAGMEGFIARWYAKNMEKNEMDEYRRAAEEVAGEAPEGGTILELAPGPGFMTIELARTGRYTVTGLDISKTFVDIATRKAREAGVTVEFKQGNASAMPFESDLFDFVACWSAFKNFADPLGALNEIHRVLKPGGRALIDDLRGDATIEAVRGRVGKMGLNRLNALITRWTFRHVLLKRAYTMPEFERLLAASDFSRFEVREKEIELAVRLWK